MPKQTISELMQDLNWKMDAFNRDQQLKARQSATIARSGVNPRFIASAVSDPRRTKRK